MSDDPEYSRPEAPFNALPPMVIAIALVLGGIEVVLQIGALGLIGGPDAVGWRIGAMASSSGVSAQSIPSVVGSQRAGFIPHPQNHVPKRRGSGPWG